MEKLHDVKKVLLDKAKSLQETIDDARENKTAISKEFAVKTFEEVKNFASEISTKPYIKAHLHALHGADPATNHAGDFEVSVLRCIEFLKNEAETFQEQHIHPKFEIKEK